MKFTKGKSGNVKGRPKGTNNNLIQITPKETIKARKLLLESIEKKESWAIKMYVSELLSNEKRLSLEIDANKPDMLQELISGLCTSISSLKTVTIDEACKILSVLNQLKLSNDFLKESEYEELIKKGNYIANMLTEEQNRAFEIWLAEAETRKFN